MTSSGPDEAAARRAEIAAAVAAARRADGPTWVRFAADEQGSPQTLTFRDREVVVREADRDRLDALLAEFPAFKLAQPATRKAPPGERHVSALADPKRVADFVDELLQTAAGRDYALAIDRE